MHMILASIPDEQERSRR
ncbi:hypothetical protein [Streptomyces sp. NPDC054804]